jgi:hypothetical protein
MQYQVHFRFNKRTGEVEEFVVETTGDDLPEAEHNRLHDQRTADLARLLERNPGVVEVAGRPQVERPGVVEPSEPEHVVAPEIEKGAT